MEDEPAERLDPVQQPVGEPAQLGIAGDVGRRVEAGPLLLPLGRVFFRAPDLEGEKLALALVEPGPEAAHLVGRQDEAREAEDRALPVFGVGPGHIGADMTELVEIGEIRHPRPPENTKARTGARASEGGQYWTASRKGR